MKQFRKFSEELNTILLDEKYLFAYSLSDGFTERLLRAEFVLDYNYNYTLEISAFKHQHITKNKSDKLIETSQLNGPLLEHIENLLSSDFNSLNQKYDHEGLAIMDIGMQQIFINLDKTTKYIEIMDDFPEDCFESPTEKILHELNEFFKHLVQQKYEDWVVE